MIYFGKKIILYLFLTVFIFLFILYTKLYLKNKSKNHFYMDIYKNKLYWIFFSKQKMFFIQSDILFEFKVFSKKKNFLKNQNDSIYIILK